MTPGLLKSCKVRDKLYLKHEKVPSPFNKAKYIKFCNISKKVKLLLKQITTSKNL